MLAPASYYSAFDESPSPRVYGETAAADGKAAFEAWLGARLPARHARAATGTVATERSPYGFDLERVATRASPTSTPLIEAAARRHARLARRRARGPHRRLPGDPRPAARPDLRAGQRGPAHQRPGVRDGVPGRRRARARPRARGDRLRVDRDDPDAGHGAVGEARPRRAAADGEDVHGRAARRRAGDRLQHLPDLELLARACSPRWSPATRSWSSRTRRAVLPLAITVQVCQEVLAEAGFDPQPGHARRRGPRRQAGRDPGRATRGQADRLHRRQRVRRLAGGATPARRSCSPRRPASTPSSSTRPSTSRRCARTSRSPSPSTPARCAPPRRTSTCPPTASRPTRATSPSPRSAPGIGAALDKLLGDDARAVELLGGVVNAGVLERLEAAASRGEVLVAVARRHPPGVRRRDGAHAHASSG